LAAQLAFPELNYLLGEYGTFSRLRPLHTNVVVYGFTVSGIMVSFYYSAQRVLKVSLGELPLINKLAKFGFYAYLVAATFLVITLLLGITANKEYAQMEWPLDIAIVVYWVIWGIVMLV